jgi:hypothetical protein
MTKTLPQCDQRGRVLDSGKCFCRHAALTGGTAKSVPVPAGACLECPYPADPGQPPSNRLFLVERASAVVVSQPTELGEGPGTELIEMNRQDYGVPPCSGCTSTARRMNELGPAGCLDPENLKSLVDEMLPRVDDYLARGELDGEQVVYPTLVMRTKSLAPGWAKRQYLAERIRQAVRRYEEKLKRRAKPSSGTDGTRQEAREAEQEIIRTLWPDPTPEERPALSRFVEAWTRP